MRTERLFLIARMPIPLLLAGMAVPTLADNPTTVGLVAAYELDGDGADSSGNGHHGVVVGTTLAADRFGSSARALEFSNNPNHGAQAQHYVLVPDAPELRPANGITVAAWSRADTSLGRAIVGKQNGTGFDDSYLLWYNSGTLWFTLSNFSASGISTPIPSLGAWHHVAGTWDGTSVRLYVDGQQVASRPFTGPNQFTDDPLVIGADNDDGDAVPDDGWDGAIDDVRIYDRALSPQEVRELAAIASTRSRNPGGSNPAGFSQVTRPVLGTTWQTVVDVATPGAAASVLVFGLGGPTQGLVLNGTVQGELLCLPPFSAADVQMGTHSVPIPLDCSLVGSTFCTQAGTVTLAPLEITLQNALDIDPGTF